MPSLSGGGPAMPEAEVTNLALARIIKGLEQLKREADELPDKDGGLAYLIAMALVEARERQKAISPGG
jgi:hypothetical protein